MLTEAQKFHAVRLAFAEYNLPTVSRVFLYLYTGKYDDSTYPRLGRNTKSVASSSSEENTNLQQAQHEQNSNRTNNNNNNKEPINDHQPGFPRHFTALVSSNLEVYLCAKALQVESLKALALAKLESRCNKDLKPADVAAMIRFVYEGSSQQDIQLRTLLMRHCTKNIALVVGDAEVVSLLKKHEPLAWSLLEEARANVTQLSTAEERLKKVKQAEISKLEAECKKLRVETESATTSLVKYKAPDLELESQVLDLKAGTASLVSRNDCLRKEISNLTRENVNLLNEQEALRDELRRENGKSRGQQHNLWQKISSLQKRLDDTKSRLRTAESADQAWARVRDEKDALGKEIAWLRGTLEYAQRRVKDTKKCKFCHQVFWALLKVDLVKDDVYIKCGDCGQKH